MTFLVGVPVHRPLIVDAALWRDRIGSVPGNDILMDRFGIVRFVTKKIAVLDLNLAEQEGRMFAAMALPASQ